MNQQNEKPPVSLVSGILKMKCPNCRKGNLFINKSMFPLKQLTDMPERCPVCGQKTELQVGFYYGTGYVSYAVSVFIFFVNLAWYWPIFGLSYLDNSIIQYLITSIIIILLLQPWIMRISRVIYIYMFVGYGSYQDEHDHGAEIDKHPLNSVSATNDIIH